MAQQTDDNKMKSTQTAVEWLFAQIPLEFSSSKSAYEKLKKALQMEKEQIEKAIDDALNAYGLIKIK